MHSRLPVLFSFSLETCTHCCNTDSRVKNYKKKSFQTSNDVIRNDLWRHSAFNGSHQTTFNFYFQSTKKVLSLFISYTKTQFMSTNFTWLRLSSITSSFFIFFAIERKQNKNAVTTHTLLFVTFSSFQQIPSKIYPFKHLLTKTQEFRRKKDRIRFWDQSLF